MDRRKLRNRIPDGTRFGRLEVIGVSDRYEKGRGTYYDCRCDCGKETTVRSDRLRNGESTSCGCYHDELLRENAKKAYEQSFQSGTSLAKIRHTQPQKNNAVGIRGVNWHKGVRKWQAQIGFKKQKYHLGYFEDIRDAEKARKAAEERLFKEFLDQFDATKKEGPQSPSS